MSLLKNKVASNAFWLIGEKIFNMTLSLLTLSLIARYFGPELYGSYNLAVAFVGLFIVFSTLGLETVTVKHIVQQKSSEGTVLLTSIVMRLLGSLVMVIIATIGAMMFYPNDETFMLLVIFIVISYFLNAFTVLEYWAQSYQKSRLTSIVRMLVKVASTIFKICIVVFELDLTYLALNLVVDALLVAIGFLYVYRKNRVDVTDWKFSVTCMKDLFSESWYFIVSGALVAVYTQLDKVIMGNILSTREVGIYTAAITLSAMWVFVPQAIITSMQPIIMNYKTLNEIKYYQSIEKLYSVIILLSISFGIIIVFLDEFIISILYGNAFSGSAQILTISIWAVGFSMLGTARRIWLVCEGIQKYAIYFLGIGAFLSISLNLVLIPKFGAIGAAYTWLIVEISTSFIVPFFFKATRKNSFLILKALTLKSLYKSSET